MDVDSPPLLQCCRNGADASLQSIIAQHAAECKQALDASNSVIESIMDAVASSNVMRLEEADVHRVTFVPLAQPATSFCTLAEPVDSCSCNSACFNTAHTTIQVLWQSHILAAKAQLRFSPTFCCLFDVCYLVDSTSWMSSACKWLPSLPNCYKAHQHAGLTGLGEGVGASASQSSCHH